jgi:hypothetical protein
MSAIGQSNGAASQHIPFTRMDGSAAAGQGSIPCPCLLILCDGQGIMFWKWRSTMNFSYSDPAMIIGASAVVLLVVIAIVFAAVNHRNRKRTEELQARFGPEYDIALREYGSRRKAEAKLQERQGRVGQMNLRTLDANDRGRYLAEWDSVQARFVDHPRGAVTEADEMINSLLNHCGYPGGSFDQRAADVSVNHAKLVDPYRRANAITVRAGKNEATTEELRSAMILYRALFEELLGVSTPLTRAEAA